ncbi:unnamed protein product [Auanema sp. JU1783]|nr:unnamed protein product [Auanema sp. JU1783]
MAKKKKENTNESIKSRKSDSEAVGKKRLSDDGNKTVPKQSKYNKRVDVAHLLNLLDDHHTNNTPSEEPEVEIPTVAGRSSHDNYDSWLSSEKVDNNVVQSILSTLNNLVNQERLIQNESDKVPECIQIDSDEDIENCRPAALTSAPADLSCSEIIGSNESYFNSTVNSTEASFCMMNGSPEEILLCFQFLIREVFLAFRRSCDSNIILRDKKMPELSWATEFLIRIRGNHFYTLTNLSCTLAGDKFDLTQVADVMKNHREICEGKFIFPKLNYKWSTVQKLAQFIPIVLCDKCRENTLEDDTIRALFEIFDSLPEGICANFTKYSSSNKTMQKKLSEQADGENSENVDDLLKRTNRYRLLLRDIFFDVPRSSDCNNVLNNTTSFIRSDNFRVNFLKKLRKYHYCTTENMTVHISDSVYYLGDVPELLQKHDSECQGSIKFAENFTELPFIAKCVSLLPLLICQDCNRSVLTEEQLNTLDTACTNLKGVSSHKGVCIISRSKDFNKRPSDTQKEKTEDPKKRFKKNNVT